MEKYKVIKRTALTCTIQLVEGVHVEIPLLYFNIALIELGELYQVKILNLRNKSTKTTLMKHEMLKLNKNIEDLKPKIVKQLKINRLKFVKKSTPNNLLSKEEKKTHIRNTMLVTLREMNAEIKKWG